MTGAVYMALALVIGVGGAVQISMLAALGRDRGPTEAAWVSILGSVVGMALLLAARAARGDAPLLPGPLDRLVPQLLIFALSGGLLALSLRGVEPYFAVIGLFGIAYIVGAAVIVPEIGIALFFGAVTAGTLLGALTLDHAGAFGAEPQHITAFRLAGVAVLMLGVVLVRAGR